MDCEEKRLIDEIRNSLNDFELPYEEGNWESFELNYGERLRHAKPKRRNTLLIRWKYGTAAAIAVAALLQMLIYWADDNDYEVVSPKSAHPIGPVTNVETVPQELGTETEPTPMPIKHIIDIPLPKATASPLAHTPVIVARIGEIQSPEMAPGEFSPPTLPAIREEIGGASAWKELPSLQIDNPNSERLTTSKWKFGLEVNSSLIADKPSISAGVLAQYGISDKIKVATGLSYSHIAAQHERQPVQVSHDTRLVGGESTLKALDIPLAVVYEPKDGWYASLGVSVLAVLDEDKVYHMERETLRETAVTDPESGTSTLVFEVVKNAFDARSLNTDFVGRHNLRYLNFSMGRKHRIHEQLDLHIEPFVKIPMGGLQRHDANLLNAGMKLKVLF